MLEIIIVIALCGKLGQMAKAKGHAGWPFQVMLVVFWFGAEFASGFLYALITDDVEFGFELYLMALGAAVLAAVTVFGVVALLPDNSPSHTGPIHKTPTEPNRNLADEDNPYRPVV